MSDAVPARRRGGGALLGFGKKQKNKVLEEEFLPHLDALYRYALHLTRDSDEAEELTQDTMLRAISSIAQYTPGTNAKAWLCRIMSNHHLNVRRKRMHIPELLMEELPEPQAELEVPGHFPSPEASYIRAAVGAEVGRALDELPLEFRQVLALADMEGFSYKEISEMLSVPMGTVMSRLFRARRILREKLGRTAQSLGVAAQAPEAGSAEPTEILADLRDYRRRRAIDR